MEKTYTYQASRNTHLNFSLNPDGSITMDGRKICEHGTFEGKVIFSAAHRFSVTCDNWARAYLHNQKRMRQTKHQEHLEQLRSQ